MKAVDQSEQPLGTRVLEASPLYLWVLVFAVGPGLVLILYSVWKNEIFTVTQNVHPRELPAPIQVRSGAGGASEDLRDRGQRRRDGDLIGYPFAYIVVDISPRIRFMFGACSSSCPSG